jgi:TonB family protein
MLKMMIATLCFLATGQILVPKPPPNPGQQRPGIIADWKQRLHDASQELRASNWKKGAGIAGSVLSEMRDRIAGGEGTESLLAVALLYRAVGEAGMGDSLAAGWDFGAAQIFYPAYSRVDLSPYGEAGKALDIWRYSGSSPAAAERAPVAGEQLQITPPKVLRGDAPTYPSAKRFACVHGPIVVQTIVNEDGRLEYPYLLSSVDPILGLAALDAVRDWRFKPAQVDGKPVRVYYRLTVNFKLPVCR